jgi:VWFA-related protein
MQYRKVLLSCILVLSFFAVLPAQTKSEDEEILRVDTQVIDVPIVVTDKIGKPLLNLKQSNFTVYEDGKPQEITDFAATAAPFEVALLLDTSGSTRSDLALIQRAAANFIASLRPGDKVSVIAYNSQTKDRQSVAVSEVFTGLTERPRVNQRCRRARQNQQRNAVLRQPSANHGKGFRRQTFGRISRAARARRSDRRR